MASKVWENGFVNKQKLKAIRQRAQNRRENMKRDLEKEFCDVRDSVEGIMLDESGMEAKN